MPEQRLGLTVGSGRLFAIRLMEHLVVATFVLNASGEVIIWNRACERLTGVPASDVLSTRAHPSAFYDKPRPSLADMVLQGEYSSLDQLYAQHDVLPAHNGLTAENWCVMPRLGHRRYLAIDAGPIYSDAGELIAVVQTMRDITVQKEAQAALEALALIDGLTGVANRRVFDESLASECRRASRDGSGLSLLLMDIDHFKSFNDAYGHPAGDACLKQVASLIKGEMRRAGDVVARYGGEEFAVILPNTSTAGAYAVADRIATAVSAQGIIHRGSLPSGRVTISVGVAQSSALLQPEPVGLLALADAALYSAKRNGRNRVELAA